MLELPGLRPVGWRRLCAGISLLLGREREGGVELGALALAEHKGEDVEGES
ncbi:MAG: hypothetical protein U0235_33045 [Polyangiaceae bacterium]